MTESKPHCITNYISVSSLYINMGQWLNAEQIPLPRSNDQCQIWRVQDLH